MTGHGGTGGKVNLWDADGDLAFAQSFDDPVLSVAITADGKLIGARDDAGSLIRLESG